MADNYSETADEILNSIKIVAKTENEPAKLLELALAYKALVPEFGGTLPAGFNKR